jgi:hypothetical protein
MIVCFALPVSRLNLLSNQRGIVSAYAALNTPLSPSVFIPIGTKKRPVCGISHANGPIQ